MADDLIAAKVLESNLVQDVANLKKALEEFKAVIIALEARIAALE